MEEVSQLTCNANSAGTARSTWAKNRLDSTARWRAVSWEMTLSEARSTAAYRLVVPWRVASWVCRWGTPGSRGRIGAVRPAHSRQRHQPVERRRLDRGLDPGGVWPLRETTKRSALAGWAQYGYG